MKIPILKKTIEAASVAGYLSGEIVQVVSRAKVRASVHLDSSAPDAVELWEPAPVEEHISVPSDGEDLNPFIISRANDRKSQPLLWESKVGYVIGSGELGLLNELQLPRRGANVSLAPDFLRYSPPAKTDGAPITESGDYLARVGDAAAGDILDQTVTSFACKDARDPSYEASPVKWRPSELTLIASTSVDPVLRSKAISVDEVRRRSIQGRESARDEVTTTPCRSGEGDLASRFGMARLRDIVAAGRRIETASSADRIASFSPGTRFRVAVDKGATGLGVTVKEIRGRFLVYRLQALPDGSPGAAEEAGVQAGDELLGVEELDFEMERWDIDQLVSYMRELNGVVILYMMRGNGPLAIASKGDLEAEMSQGVPQVDVTDAREEGGPGAGAEGEPRSRKQEKAPRLLEILEEEGFMKPSEVADTSRLHSQIGDRARQWDSGELWLSVAELVRRPSPQAIAAFARQWEPGEPPGWDESDSSDGESQLQPPVKRDGSEEQHQTDPLSVTEGKLGDNEHEDLDTIGTALLGQPLFSDTLSVVGLGSSEGGAESKANDGKVDWSPWPQLAALEKDASARDTVVPTQGIRKALNVRVLEQMEPPNSSDESGTRHNSKSNKANGTPQYSTTYSVWVMDVESGAEWRVRRTHAEFAELWEVCTGMRPSLARLDFPSWVPGVKETPGTIEARRPRLEGYLQRLCNLLYMGPLHPSSAHVAHLLQDFLGTTPRVETLSRLQKSRPERELRQALQVRAWQVLRLPPLERAVSEFVRNITDAPAAPSKKAIAAETILKKLTNIIERLQYVVMEGCYDELREMVRASAVSLTAIMPPQSDKTGRDDAADNAAKAKGRGELISAELESGEAEDLGEERYTGKKEIQDEQYSASATEIEDMAVEDEALELISGSVRRQVEAEVFVPVMGRLYKLLQTEGETSRREKSVASGIQQAAGKPQIYHGIPVRYISPSSWGSASRLLRTVGSFTLPSDKLDALVAVAHGIPALYHAEHPGDGSSQLGADDFLPIFIYVFVNSEVEGMVSLAVVLETLCDPKKMMGEAGFCLATLSAALQHLERSVSSGQKKKSSSLLGRRSC